MRMRICLLGLIAVLLSGCSYISQANEEVDVLGALTEDSQEKIDAEVEEMLEAAAAERAERVATPEPTTTPGPVVFGDDYPEVIAVAVDLVNNDNWRFDVTLSSPYDTPKRYADAWRVLDESGRQLGIRELGHDHASEQPFTRSETVRVPRGTTTVWVEGRDQANGWSGQRFEVMVS